MEAASEADNPYDFLDGYFTFKNVKEVLSDGDWQHYYGWKLAGEEMVLGKSPINI